MNAELLVEIGLHAIHLPASPGSPRGTEAPQPMGTPWQKGVIWSMIVGELLENLWFYKLINFRNMLKQPIQ